MKSIENLPRNLKLRAGLCYSPLDIVCGWALAKVCGVDSDAYESANPLCIDPVDAWVREAERLGHENGLTSSLPIMFLGTPLATAWESGAHFRCECECAREAEGTQERWDSLGSVEQCAQWDQFHDLCANGMGEHHHFYNLLMKEWLVGYAGH